MLRHRRMIFFLLALTMAAGEGAAQMHNQLQWEKLPALPDTAARSGLFIGVSHGHLIVAGGAILPGPAAGDQGGKLYSDRVFILQKGAGSWSLASQRLPYPLAYGVSATYGDNVLLAGGRDSERHYAQVYRLADRQGTLVIDTLPSLPLPLAQMSGAVVDDILFVAGGSTQAGGAPGKYFFALQLSAAHPHWLTLDSWPGPARMQAVCASLDGDFFLFGGIGPPGSDSTSETVLRDAYRFTPSYREGLVSGGHWTKLAAMPTGVAQGASPAPTIGLAHILFPAGGEPAGRSGSATPSSPGRLLAYHAESDAWVDFGKRPGAETLWQPSVTRWNGSWVIAGGQDEAGKASGDVLSLSKNLGFGWINWAALMVYLVFILWIGLLFNRKGQTTKNFFTAGGKIPWWVAGLSIYGSQLSAITVMAIPAIVYATDWSLAIGSLVIIAIVPLVVRYFIPFFKRLPITSAYEYLQLRFSGPVRMIGSITFILFQLGRMGIVLFLPAVAIASVTGINVYLLISIMGFICLLYTMKGGIEAVVWTEMVQVFILLGGAILCLVIAITGVEGGLGQVIARGMETHKFTLFHLGWKPDRLVLWVCVVGFFFFDIIPYTSDQTVVQRYLTVKDEKEAAKSLWTNALMIIPTIVIYFGLGTVLYVFYHSNPHVLPSEKVGEILPYFVVQELPVGIAGLVIAGIFAASQSALGSGMNSISAAFVTDIYPYLRRGSSDQESLRTARMVTATVGLFGIASAMLVAALDVEFIFDLFQEILGIIGGSLAGVFILGIFTRRANTAGVICGIVLGFLAVWLTKSFTDVSLYLYGAISILTTVIGGYAFSLLGPQPKNIRGLTYATLDRSPEAARPAEVLVSRGAAERG